MPGKIVKLPPTGSKVTGKSTGIFYKNPLREVFAPSGKSNEGGLYSCTLSITVFSSANKKPSREIHGTAVKIISYT